MPNPRGQMLSPTMTTVQNPDLLHRFLLGVVERISEVQGRPLVEPTPIYAPRRLSQEDLVDLNVDLSATARSTTSSAAPTATDDETLGYSKFSLWHHDNGATQDVYMLLDPLGGAAVWKKITP